MKKEQFFEYICRNCVSEQEKIATILFARGFLIEQINGKYYLSDNAHAEDAQYLANAVEDYKIGKVVDSGKRISSHRRSWDILSSQRSYQYDSLIPQEVELFIDSNAIADQAISLFEGLKLKGGEAGPNTISWPRFTREMLGSKVELAFLEPYIALYVKAVSACGVYTASSCDGNHEYSRKIFVEADKPSNIWHRNIWEHLVQPRFGPFPFIGSSIPFTESNQFEWYLKINEIAVFLYKNRVAIRAIKEQSVSGIPEQYRKSRGARKKDQKNWEKQFSDFYSQECQRVVTAASRTIGMEKGDIHGII